MNNSIVKFFLVVFFVSFQGLALSASGNQVLETVIASDNDDAEERLSTGTVYITNSSDLELGYDGSYAQAVGLRFTDITVPQGATITTAYVQFVVDETNSASVSLTIKGEDVDSASGFESSVGNISNRTTTTASILWSPAGWDNVGDVGLAQRTPDISSVVNEIVNRPGWSSGNAMVLVVTGTGTRTAEAEPGGAALLHVEYSTDGPTQYNLITTTSGSGTVSLSPAGGTYDDGTVVTVTATPGAGWHFDNWSGDLIGTTNPVTITMDSNKSVTASFSGSTSSGVDCDLLTNTTQYWPAPSITKPEYLVPITDPTFGTKITRIVGNPGDAIPNLSDKVWADQQLRHGYSKREPWNCDQSMIYLDRHYPPLWLDGETYEVLFTRDKPASRLRWSHTEPEIMYFAYGSSSGNSYVGRWNVVEDVTSSVVDLTGYSSISFGKGEGNFTNDGKKVAICAIRLSDGHEVIFVVNVETGTKGPDMDMDGVATEINNCTISPLGNYLVIVGDWGQGSDRVQVRNASTGSILYTETAYGMPSHFDVQIDQNGDEVIAGVAKTSAYGLQSGTIIKRVLATGEMSVICDRKYASHTSGRALQRQGWVFVTYQNRNTSYPPYLNELVAVKLDGSRTERICHLHSNNFDYVAESHGVPSPDGLRVMWASDWDNNDFPVQAYVADYRDKVINEQFTLSTATNGSGSVSLSPAGGVYNSGTVVTLTATPGAGWHFDNWSGDLTGTVNPATITVDSNKSVTASFANNNTPHSADTNGDWSISQAEVGTFITSYNNNNNTETTANGDITAGRITLREVLRVIYLYNNGGAYQGGQATVDTYDVNGVGIAPETEEPPLPTDNTITVANSTDAGVGSLRNAIANATYGDTITFDESLDKITLATEILIDKSITIDGNGITIVSGNSKTRIFRIYNEDEDIFVSLLNMGIVDASNSIDEFGGAIYNNGENLTLENCLLNNNANTVANGKGGAIYSSGSLTITNSVFNENTAQEESDIYSTNDNVTKSK